MTIKFRQQPNQQALQPVDVDYDDDDDNSNNDENCKDYLINCMKKIIMGDNIYKKLKIVNKNN